MSEFCLAQEISHQDTKSRMCRNCSKQSHYSSSESKFKNIKDIFDCSEAHANDHSVDNSIKRFIEVFVVVENKPHKEELAEFFNKCHLEEGVKKLLDDIIFFCEDPKVDWIADGHCDYRANATVDKTYNEQAEWFSLVLVL